MTGVINLRTDFNGDLDDLQKIANGIYTKAELDAAIHSAAMLAAVPLAAGIEIQIGGKRYISAYNETGTATVVGEVVVIAYAEAYTTKAVVTAKSAVLARTAVSLAIAADHVLGWYQYAGEAEALVDGDTTDVSAGDFLKIYDTDTAFIQDGAARTAHSAAVAIDANASTAALKTVMLIPEQHTIDGA